MAVGGFAGGCVADMGGTISIVEAPKVSRSYHTDKESVTAKRNLKREECGCCVVLPRIIQRKPRPGDIHPVDKKALRGILRSSPEEYVYGLDRIEFKPREAPRSEEGYTLIGAPFGFYMRVDKSITLFSLPMTWVLREISPGLTYTVTGWGGNIQEENGKIIVEWPSENHLGLWFTCTVIHHELGHHYRHQYRRKRKHAYWTEEEMVANLHGSRLTREMFQNLGKQKRAREEQIKEGRKK